MINRSIEDAKKELDMLGYSCINDDQVVRVFAKKGNAILISEKKYNDLKESLYLLKIPGMKEDIESVI